jgi:hypothetical protein
MNREELQQYSTDGVTVSVAAVLSAHLEPLRDQVAALRGTVPAISSCTSVTELQAARQQNHDRLQRIDTQREKIRNSTWTCPAVELAEPNFIVNLPTNMTSTDWALREDSIPKSSPGMRLAKTWPNGSSSWISSS